MCGIAGFINRSGIEADRHIVNRMLHKLHHRGPDDSNSWTNENISLGYTRLSILDLTERGNQPFVTLDGTGVLIYNGEVYNFQELRKELENEGVTFISRSDTEVVLYALHIWGPEKAISKFNGMFAFAYYNLKNRELWLGRDRAGIKPLYTASANGVLVFASEMKSIFEHPDVKRRPDLHSITTYILLTRLDRWTPFENIRELKPGCLLKISEKGEEEIIYFDLLRDLDVNRIVENEKYNFQHFLTNLEQILNKSVDSHLVSDAPVAVMCSGGVDSSLLTALASERKKDIVAYVADVEDLDVSEKVRAERVCNHLNIELRTVPVSREKFFKLWPFAAYYHDEPIFFRQNMLHMAVAEQVREDGYKVLLCGEGADELFGGYSWQASVYEMWQVRRKRAKFYPDNRIIRLLSKLIPNFRPLDMDQLQAEPFSHIGKNPPTGRLDPRDLAAVDGGQRAFRRQKMMEILSPIEKIEERAFLARSFEDFLVHLATSLKTVDKMNMAFSVESRVPYLDDRIIDFALHIPAKHKYQNKISKPLLKECASHRLPRELMHLPKIGFGTTRGLWKDSYKLLKNGWVENILKWRISERDYIYESIRKDANLEFQLATLEIWARIFLDGQAPENISNELLSL